MLLDFASTLAAAQREKRRERKREREVDYNFLGKLGNCT